MQSRRSLITQALLLGAAMSLLAAACGGGGRTTEPRAPGNTRAATTPPAATRSADPLQGEWRTDFTCHQSVRAIRARLPEKQILKQIGSWRSLLEDHGWGGNPTEEDPCQGATGTDARLARFADGNLALCNAKTGECEVHATYQVNGAHLIVVDPEGNLCGPCPVTWEFEIARDQLTFHVDPNPWVIGTWEAAPWTREG